MTPEQAVKHQISQYLKFKGYFFWWNATTGIFDPRTKKFRKNRGAFQMNGVADILGVTKDGRFFAIECKSPTSKRVTEDQLRFLNQVKANQGIAIIARSIDDVIPYL